MDDNQTQTKPFSKKCRFIKQKQKTKCQTGKNR